MLTEFGGLALSNWWEIRQHRRVKSISSIKAICRGCGDENTNTGVFCRPELDPK